MRHSYEVNMANSVQLHGAAAGVILRPEPSSTAANPAGRVQNHMRGSLKTQRALPLADLPKREKLSQEPISDISVIVANTQHYLNYFLGRQSTETEAVDIQQRESRHARITAKSRKTGEKL